MSKWSSDLIKTEVDPDLFVDLDEFKQINGPFRVQTETVSDQSIYFRVRLRDTGQVGKDGYVRSVRQSSKNTCATR